MFPGRIDPKQMEAMMSKLGIKTDEIQAKKVIIELDDKNIVIENPQISAMTMQGQKTYTIVGEERVEEKENEDDIKLIMEQTNCTKEQARIALKENQNDIAEAINSLKE